MPRPHLTLTNVRKSGQAWAEWLKGILLTARAKIYFIVFLTGALGLRCGEALCIKQEDLALEATTPKAIIKRERKGGRNRKVKGKATDED